MSEKKQKLEFTWIGMEMRPELEPRSLVEDADVRESLIVTCRKGKENMKAEKSDALKYFEGLRYNKSYDLPSVAAIMQTFWTKPKELYHYAADGRVKYLLGKRADIVCKHTGLMDDVAEVRGGTYLLVKYISVCYPDQAEAIKRILDEAWCEYEKIPHGSWNEYHDEANHPKRNMIMHLMPYVFCLMPEKDSPYQWRNYMDKNDRSIGGCCFGFSADELRRAIKTRNLQLAAKTSSVLQICPCLYRRIDDEKIEKLVYSLIVDLKEEFVTFDADFQSVMRILGAIFTIAPLIKDEEFFREQEVRLILVSPGFGDGTEKSFVVPARKSTGFGEIKIQPIDLIQSIMLSPQGDKTKLRKHVVRLCPSAKSKVVKSIINESVVKNYITFAGDVDDVYENTIIETLAKDRSAIVQERS